MSLAVLSGTSGRLDNYCIFGGNFQLELCGVSRRNNCSNDAKNDDGWYICNAHLSRKFKMQKNAIPIADREGTTFYRSSGISLVGHEETGKDRILIPTRANYESVLNIQHMSLADQLVLHMIYENLEAQRDVCNNLRKATSYERVSERFEKALYPPLKALYDRTTKILATTNPLSYCARVIYDSIRVYGSSNQAEDVAGALVKRMPPFIINLINKCVAPEILKIETKDIMLRNCATCHIDETGLVASVRLYNPIMPRFLNKDESDYIHVETVVRFSGNSIALNEQLAIYCEHQLDVPLMLGVEIIATSNTAIPQTQPVSMEELVNPSNVPPIAREEPLIIPPATI
ncbi:VP39 [Rachiplusia nu nucleopolyhedrovirus]|uniref:VP39 n=1 Tax=Rachiplusia nu nucleopolyhedrovirus TaxID=2605775 RepID=A0AAF1DB57_9ABAC|nr:VP39 [Rachiplusia nu nucleopolyhedrovirus]QEI03677.1 VP39 [Rachiplusia nu nucleopolyhedrovirus]